MSRPIEATPILTGEDAKRFLEEFDRNKLTPEVLTKLERCARMYKEFMARMDPPCESCDSRTCTFMGDDCVYKDNNK